MKLVAWIPGFNDTAKMAFSGRQNEDNLIQRVIYSSTKSLMTLEKSHDMYLWVEGLFQYTKML